MSFYFGDGYTHIPWHTIAIIIRTLINDGQYPAPNNYHDVGMNGRFETNRLHNNYFGKRPGEEGFPHELAIREELRSNTQIHRS